MGSRTKQRFTVSAPALCCQQSVLTSSNCLSALFLKEALRASDSCSSEEAGSVRPAELHCLSLPVLTWHYQLRRNGSVAQDARYCQTRCAVQGPGYSPARRAGGLYGAGAAAHTGAVLLASDQSSLTFELVYC